MLIADSYLGHRDDDDLTDRLAETDPLRVVLSDTDRQRSRVRTETIDGRDLGVVVAEDLADGDVLETDDGELAVVELARIDALVFPIDDADVSPTAALELGHALGNRHWDLALREGEALFPVTDIRERMLEFIADHLPAGVETRFESVRPTTFDDDGGDHAHGHGDGHSHGHDDGHSHGHDGHTHAHDDDHGVRTVDGGES